MPIKETRKKIKEPGQLTIKLVLLLVSCFFSLTSNGQCAMCRAALESEGNTAKAEAVNDGIVYLMIIPYLLVGAIGYVIYRSRKNLKEKSR